MNIRDCVRVLASTSDEIYCKICKVDKVYEDTRTVDCSPLDPNDAPILDANLQANQYNDKGLVVFPKEGSYVVVAFLSKSAAVVVLTDEIDRIEVQMGDPEGSDTRVSAEITNKEIIFNGGHNKGMVLIEELTNRLNELIRKFNAHTHTIGMDGIIVQGSAATQSNKSPVSVPATGDTQEEFKISDYENQQIKQ